ncbi:MAG: flagellin [Phycisphaerales bacterium]
MSRIGTDVSSLAAQRFVARADQLVFGSLQRLSTGTRINRGADDPAGLIASENLRASLAQLEAESRAIERTDAVANVAEGALGEVSELLNGANAAAVAQANTAGLSQAERDAYQLEIDSARQAAARIVSSTRFNGQPLLDGSLTLSVGSSGAPGDSLQVADLNLESVGAGQPAISDALARVATLRGQIGSFQKDALAPQLRSNQAEFENTSAANSIIRDTDFAAEAAQLARARVLGASSRSVLALTNARSRDVLNVLA